MATASRFKQSADGGQDCFFIGRLMTHLTPHDFLGQSAGQRQRLVPNLAVQQNAYWSFFIPSSVIGLFP